MNNGNKKILVIGSINMDLVYKVKKAPKAGQSLIAKDNFISPGGKGANQAVAASKLGANVSYIAKVGNDEYGKILKKNLADNNVKTDSLITDENSKTGTAIILLEESGENRIIVSKGANGKLTPKDIKNRLFKKKQYDVVLLQLEIPLNTVEFIIKQARKLEIPVILDAGPSKKCDISIFKNIEIISPNQSEIYNLIGEKAETLAEAKKACKKLKEAINAKKIILKMGKNGSLLYDQNGYKFFDSFKVEAKDTTAAGDAFSAALAVGFVSGWTDERIITYSNAVGALATTKVGAQNAVPDREEVEMFLKKYQIKVCVDK